jgi:hypothetical protein
MDTRKGGASVVVRARGKGAVIIGVTTAVWIGIYHLFPNFWENRALDLFFLVISLWAYIAAWLWRKGRAGAVLLDLGRSKTHKMFLVLGGLGAVSNLIPLVGSLSVFSDESGVEDVYRYFFGVSFGICMLFLGLRRSEIREFGILYFDRFLKWKSIESYEWEGKDGLTLTLRSTRRLPFCRRASFGIPAVQKDNVNRLLAEHVSSGTEGGNVS